MAAFTTGLACLASVNGLCLCAALTPRFSLGARGKAAMIAALGLTLDGDCAALDARPFTFRGALKAANAATGCKHHGHIT